MFVKQKVIIFIFLENIFLLILFLLILIVLILLRVAFYTLIERKIIRINQLRLGPNKIFLFGFIQPLIDGFKLFLKMLNNSKKNNLIFFISPVISFIIRISFWCVIINLRSFFKNILILFFLGISVYSFVIRGWSRFSKFGYLGGIRASSQTVSYEISLAILIISLIYFLKNFQLKIFFEKFFFLLIFPLFICWIISIISETNRAPFDFSEGERELISGFNIEYGSSGFILFFLSEYSIIIFFSFFTIFLLNLNYFIFFLILFLFISLRTSFPRFRYDFLIQLIWFKILPFLCVFLLCFILL